MKSPPEHPEQRRHQRVEARSDVWVRHSEQAPSEPGFGGGMRCQLVDLSFGGAKIIAAALVGPLGAGIELGLPTAGGDIVSVTGVIVRTETYRNAHVAAVRFDDVSSAQHVRLSEVLKSLTENSSLLVRTRPLKATSAPDRPTPHSV